MSPDRPPLSSVISLYRKARDGAEEVRLPAVVREMLDRLVDQEARLLPRALLSEQRDERRFPRIGIASGRLARRGLVAAMVDEVVRDLERQADIARIASVRRARIGRHLVHDARRLDAIF